MEKVLANYEKGKKINIYLLMVIALGGKITKQFGIVASHTQLNKRCLG
jgi:hypothetical protein